MSEKRLHIDPKMLPMLVGDVGGTNARFAILGGSGEAFAAEEVLAAADFPSFEAAVKSYLSSTGIQPKSACLAVAAPILGDEVALTNREWRFSVSEMKKALDLSVFEVINDFKALAMGIPYLDADELVSLGEEAPQIVYEAPRVILGPGTGLGVASLIHTPSGWLPLPGEGGHCAFAPGNDREIKVLTHLLSKQEHVSAEDILSGPGLERLYRALLDLGEIEGHERDSPRITNGAISGDPGCALCLDMFCGILGAFAGDLALTLGAHGGVYLAGGILPQVLAFVESSSLRTRFENKGKMSHFVKHIPTYIITARLPALMGAAAWCARSLASR